MASWSDAAGLETLKSRLDLALVVFGILTALIALASWSVGVRLDRVRDREKEALRQRLQKAEDSAVQLSASLMSAQKQNEQIQRGLRFELDAARLEAKASDEKVQKLEQRTSPRTLEPRGAAALAEKLRGCSQPVVSVTTALGDAEANSFARQLEEVFRKAGWSSRGVSQAVFTGVPVGVTLRVPSKNLYHPCAPQVQQALKSVGINAPAVVVEGMQTDALDIVVGKK